MAGAPPPSVIEVEKEVLNAIFLQADTLFDIITIFSKVKEKVFYDARNRKIYVAMCELYELGIKTDYNSVRERLRKKNELQDIGNNYLIEIESNYYGASHYRNNCFLLLEYYFRRLLIWQAQQAIQKSSDLSIDIFDAVHWADDQLQSIINFNINSSYASLEQLAAQTGQVLTAQLTDPTRRNYINTHIDYLNTKLNGGFFNANLIVLAARPGMGKTAFALSLIYNIAKAGGAVGFFSLEMSSDSIIRRLLNLELNLSKSPETRATIQYILKNSTETNNIKTLIQQGLSALKTLPIFIDDTASLDIKELALKARRMKQHNNIKMLVVDYLQLIKGNNSNREREISIISSTLKQIAKELNIPVLALAQLNRTYEARVSQTKKVNPLQTPLLSDLRESGAIEQDADVVMFIHRPEMLLKGEDKHSGGQYQNKAILAVEKHRDGATGTVDMYCDIKYNIFKNAWEPPKPKQADAQVPASEVHLAQDDDMDVDF